jgi:hypothetical protein
MQFCPIALPSTPGRSQLVSAPPELEPDPDPEPLPLSLPVDVPSGALVDSLPLPVDPGSSEVELGSKVVPVPVGLVVPEPDIVVGDVGSIEVLPAVSTPVVAVPSSLHAKRIIARNSPRRMHGG